MKTKEARVAARYVPPGARKITVKGAEVAIYLYERAGAPYALGYWGTSSKAWFHHRYANEEQRQKRVAYWVEQARLRWEANVQRKAQNSAERAAPNKLQVGHILVSSWGYDQTNVDFYEVTRVMGQSVELVKIGANNTSHGWAGHDTGHAIPQLDGKKGKPFVKRVQYGNQVKIESYAWARIWNGKPIGWTAYA